MPPDADSGVDEPSQMVISGVTKAVTPGRTLRSVDPEVEQPLSEVATTE